MRAMGTPMNGLSQLPTPSIAVEEFHNSNDHPLIQNSNIQPTFSQFEPSSAAIDDSFEEMLSLPELIQCHWDLTDGTQIAGDEGLPFEGPYDELSLLEARLPSQQIIQTMLPISAQLLQQHQLLLSDMVGSHQSSANTFAVESAHFPPGADSDSTFKSPN